MKKNGSRDWLARLNQNGSIVEQNVRDSRWIRYDQHHAADGKKIYVRTDITDERNAAESFRLLFENNPVPMWVVERSTPEIHRHQRRRSSSSMATRASSS